MRRKNGMYRNHTKKNKVITAMYVTNVYERTRHV